MWIWPAFCTLTISSLKYCFHQFKEGLWKFHAFFIQNIFFKSVNKNEKNSYFNFFHVNIFSDCCLKNINMFICHFLSTFFLKYYEKFSQIKSKIFYQSFLNFSWKSGQISCVIFWYLFDFRISIDGRVNRMSFLNYFFLRYNKTFIRFCLMKLTTLPCDTGLCHLTRNL